MYSLLRCYFVMWTLSVSGVTYGHTVDVLKLDVSERDEAVVFVVLLRQIQRLRGFAPLGVVEAHRTRKINEDLDALWGLSWEHRDIQLHFSVWVTRWCCSECKQMCVRLSDLRWLPSSAASSFMEKSLTGWLKAMVIRSCKQTQKDQSWDHKVSLAHQRNTENARQVIEALHLKLNQN